jgi:hypothetical protein
MARLFFSLIATLHPPSSSALASQQRLGPESCNGAPVPKGRAPGFFLASPWAIVDTRGRWDRPNILDGPPRLRPREILISHDYFGVLGGCGDRAASRNALTPHRFFDNVPDSMHQVLAVHPAIDSPRRAREVTNIFRRSLGTSSVWPPTK